jgi:tetratricopeptide (TPR) repeat protein
MSHAVPGKGEAAEKAYSQASAVQARLVKDFPAAVDYRVDLALTYYNLAETYEARRDKEQAKSYYAQAVSLLDTLPASTERLSLFINLSHKLSVLGKPQEALRWADRVIDQLNAMLREEVKPDQRPRIALPLALAYYMRGLLLADLGEQGGLALADLGKREQALSDFDRALSIREAALPPQVEEDCKQRRGLLRTEVELKKIMKVLGK